MVESGILTAPSPCLASALCTRQDVSPFECLLSSQPNCHCLLSEQYSVKTSNNNLRVVCRALLSSDNLINARAVLRLLFGAFNNDLYVELIVTDASTRGT